MANISGVVHVPPLELSPLQIDERRYKVKFEEMPSLVSSLLTRGQQGQLSKADLDTFNQWAHVTLSSEDDHRLFHIYLKTLFAGEFQREKVNPQRDKFWGQNLRYISSEEVKKAAVIISQGCFGEFFVKYPGSFFPSFVFVISSFLEEIVKGAGPLESHSILERVERIFENLTPQQCEELIIGVLFAASLMKDDVNCRALNRLRCFSMADRRSVFYSALQEKIATSAGQSEIEVEQDFWEQTTTSFDKGALNTLFDQGLKGLHMEKGGVLEDFLTYAEGKTQLTPEKSRMKTFLENLFLAQCENIALVRNVSLSQMGQSIGGLDIETNRLAIILTLADMCSIDLESFIDFDSLLIDIRDDFELVSKVLVRSLGQFLIKRSSEAGSMNTLRKNFKMPPRKRLTKVESFPPDNASIKINCKECLLEGVTSIEERAFIEEQMRFIPIEEWYEVTSAVLDLLRNDPAETNRGCFIHYIKRIPAGSRVRRAALISEFIQGVATLEEKKNILAATYSLNEETLLDIIDQLSLISVYSGDIIEAIKVLSETTREELEDITKCVLDLSGGDSGGITGFEVFKFLRGISEEGRLSAVENLKIRLRESEDANLKTVITQYELEEEAHKLRAHQRGRRSTTLGFFN